MELLDLILSVLVMLVVGLIPPLAGVLAYREHAPLFRQAREEERHEDAISHLSNILFFILWPALNLALILTAWNKVMTKWEWVFGAILVAYVTSSVFEFLLKRRLRKKGRKAA